ncbi:MAG: retropepsin-like aspartic protease [Bacteroidota bacterium]
MAKSIKFRVIDFAADGYHWLVDCNINGQKYWLVIDTGATRSVFDHSALGDVEVTNHPQGLVIGFGSQTDSISTATLKEIEIGGIAYFNFDVAVANLSNLIELYADMASVKLVGILGCDFLMRNTSSINIQQRRIYLKLIKGENE